MSDEIILISSSNDDDSSIEEVLPLLPAKLESSEVGTPGAVVNHYIHVNDLDAFLGSKPHTFVKQTTHSVDCSKKYKYCICACSCSFHLNLIHDVAKKIVMSQNDQKIYGENKFYCIGYNGTYFLHHQFSKNATKY
jgi:hypothetical protein